MLSDSQEWPVDFDSQHLNLLTQVTGQAERLSAHFVVPCLPDEAYTSTRLG